MSKSAPNAIVNTWPWKALGSAPVKSAPMTPAAKACIQAPIMLLVAFLLYRFGRHPVMPAIVAGLAVLVLVGGLAVPPLFRAFEKLGLLLTRGVAAALTWGLLVPFFYIIFGFGRLILMITRQDPLQVRFPSPQHTTFWEARKPVPSLDQYRKQH